MQNKKCDKCECYLEISDKNFSKVGKDKKYFSNSCKNCLNKIKRLRRDTPRFNPYNEINKTKRCANCLLYFSYDEMSKNASEYLGVGAYCKPCHSKRMAAILAKRRSKLKGSLISQDEYDAILNTYEHKCKYCECDVKIGENLNWDHYMPIFLGGENTVENIVPSCVDCNSIKGKKHPDDFLKEIELNKDSFVNRVYRKTIFKPETVKHKEKSNCLSCSKEINKGNKYCSAECSAKSQYKVNWDNIDLDYECSKVSSMVELTEKLGCSDNAIKKRMKKINFDRNKYFKVYNKS
jgi:predicted nucleic acid-binding Zn ribbon protein